MRYPPNNRIRYGRRNVMRVMILANNDVGLYKFRKELVEALLKENEVYICLPDGDFVEKLVEMGSKFVPCTLLDRHGTNPVQEMKLLAWYKNILKAYRPDIVFTYTIKPNVYGGMACASQGIPYVVNVTGLGTSVENGGLLQKLTLFLYKYGLRKAQTVFFQNKYNHQFMREKEIVGDNCKMLPGSGVNLQEHCCEPYPSEEDGIRFLFVGRIMKDKGIEEYLECARRIHEKYPACSFGIVGFYDEENYRPLIEQYEAEGIVTFYGRQTDVHSFMRSYHALIQPSYHEGLSNVLLEAAACGRPVLASDIPGCKETFEEGISGYGFEVKNPDSLVAAVDKFLALSRNEREQMGLCGRQKVEREFSRQIVIDKYFAEIQKVEEKQ